MNIGKLPPDLLERLLGTLDIQDPRVLVGPMTGEDAAVIDMGGHALVAKSDPITFATDLIGWYAVQVNANDVACMGAVPKWFLATVLLPENAEPRMAEDIFSQTVAACKELGVTLVGGHSEVTHQLQRPILVGHMLGEVASDSIVRTSGARPGDDIVLTKGIAIEGTSVLAREAREALLSTEVPPEMVRAAGDYLFKPGISVVQDALTSCKAVPVHSMHDPTEGGLATGLREIAAAAQVGIEIDQERIPVLPECGSICAALGLDPLGLLASGALLITLSEEHTPSLFKSLAESNIQAQVIGKVTPASNGLRLHTPQGIRGLPSFERDELARYFSES